MLRTSLPGAVTGCKRHSRRGAALIMALVVLAVVSLLMAEQVRRVLADRRHERLELLRVQTEAAADAALRTAVERLQADATWNGAVWDIPREVIPSGAVIQVEVKVQDGFVRAEAAAELEDSVVCRVTRTGRPKP